MRFNQLFLSVMMLFLTVFFSCVCEASRFPGFEYHVIDHIGSRLGQTALADVNGDGRMDAIANSDRSGLFWYEIPRDPTKKWKSHVIAPSSFQKIHGGVSPKAVGDLDSDGDNDVDGDGDIDICSKPWTTGNEHFFLRNMAVENRTGGDGSVEISGELKRWHKITLTLDGPFASELSENPNPFLDYSMKVTFTHESGSPSYKVLGYFAADGNCAESSAGSGTKWCAHLSPDKTGKWNYRISFFRGKHVAVNAGAVSKPVAKYNGLSGSFTIGETDKKGRDLRGKGRLDYVGLNHLRFADGEYFLKAGADAPENFLAYKDFDNTPNVGGRRKSWQPHVRDWRNGDPTWKNGKGKGIIGAVNYLSKKGVNAFSFLTYSFNGDDKNVFPYVKGNERTHMDCSKLAQWEIVFNHADKMGMYLHFKTQETENDQDMDGGRLGVERKLYYRELIARFGHHLALNWNLGEENTNTTSQLRQFLNYFRANDPYHHNIVVHTFPGAKKKVYTPLLGKRSWLTGVSLQCNFRKVFQDTKEWREKSNKAGRPWIVANDEQGPASTGVKPDSFDPGHNDIRKNVLWGNIMAGGAGIELYFGYKFPNSDLSCNDFRSRDLMWDQCRYALEFFKQNIVPFWEMRNRDELVSGKEAWCLAGKNQYVVYLKNGGTAKLNLEDTKGHFKVSWFNPRKGGKLKAGTVKEITGGGIRDLGTAPANTGKDWIVLVRP